MTVATRHLVTGGAGFLGAHVVRALLARPRTEVTVLDNLSAGTRDALAPFEDEARFRFLRGDVRDEAALGDALDGVGTVHHLAANPEVRSGEQRPGDHFEQNAVATQRLLEAMRARGVGRLLFTSTSTVYGLATKRPTPEDYAPLLPISVYGASKLAAEAMIAAYAATFRMRALVFRLANVVGPGSTHGVAFDFVRKLRADPKRLEVLGDGTQTKSYVHVDDVVRGMLLAAERRLDAADARFVETYNVGSDDAVAVRDIVPLVVGAMRLAPPPRISTTAPAAHGGGWTGDVPTMLLDCARLKALGWKPQRTSSDALRDAVRALLAGPRP